MSAITPKQVEALTSAVKSGADLETACHYAGISIAVCYRHLERGKLESERLANDEQPDPAAADFLAFWEELRKARADAIVRSVAQIQKAATEGAWQAAAWWLERTVPETYGKNRQAPAVNTEAKKQLEN